MFAAIKKAVSWIIGIILAILSFLGIYKQPEKPVEPPTTTASSTVPGDPFETPVIGI